MRRITWLYPALVLAPVAVVVALSAWMREDRLRELAADEAARVARTALTLAGWEDLPAGAESPALGRRVLPALEGRAGYEAAVYRDGRRVAATDNDFGPLALSEERTDGRESGGPEETAVRTVELEGRAGVVASRGSDAGRAGELAVLVAPSRPRRPPPLPEHRWPVILGVTLGLLLAGWGVLSGPHPSRRWLATVLPALALWWVVGRTVVQLGADRDAALGRELALASVLIPEAPERSAAELAGMTGFPVSRVEDGTVTSSSLPPDAPLRATFADLPLPPPERTASGVLEAGGVRHRYLAARGSGRGLTVVSAPVATGLPPGATLVLAILALAATCSALLFPFRAEPEDPARSSATS